MMEDLPDKHPMETLLKRLQRERREILSLPPDGALEAILDAPHPAPLVHGFAEADLHLLIQDIGPSDALPLLALASDRQLQFIMDMEIWDQDRIDPESSRQWIDLLHRADPDRLTRWLMGRQTAFAVYHLMRNVTVQTLEHDQDPSDFGDGFVTVDSVFYVRPLDFPEESPADADQRKETLLEVLRRMADHDHDRYQRILLESAAVIPAEYEEEAYRMRNVRLAEKGFLPFDEAVGIYQPLRPGEFVARASRSLKTAPAPEGALPVPVYPMKLMETDGLFASALRRIASPEAAEQVLIEFATLCNRVAVADRRRIKDRKALAAVVEKVCGYLNIGMERLCGDDRADGCPRSSARIARFPLADFFRVGYGLAMDLKRRAERWRKSAWFEDRLLGLAFWGEAWLGVLGGLLVKRPLFFDNFATGVLYRDFADLEDIRRTGTVLEHIVAMDRLLAGMAVSDQKPAGRVPVTYKNLVLTLWARHHLGLSGEPAPVACSDFAGFYADLWTEGAKPKRVRKAMKARFLSWLSESSKTGAADITERLGPVLDDLFGEIETELGRVSVRDLNPRYVQLFLLDDG